MDQIFHSRSFNRNGQRTRNKQLKNSFGDMDILKQSNNVEKLLRGLIRQRAEKADANFVNDVRIKTEHMEMFCWVLFYLQGEL